MNRVFLSGFVSTDIEFRITNQGNAVATFALAVRRPRSKDNTADFFRIVCWRKTAEFVSEHFQKGSGIEIQGTLSNKKWVDKEGRNRIAAEVIADEIEFPKRKRDEQKLHEPENNYEEDEFNEIGQDESFPF